jgi:UDP-2-acetamido-2-deoxy-ribo-hexuluronate aminotransferase
VKDRDALAAKLKEQGIPTAIYYPKCLHEQPVYEYLGYKLEDFPNSVKVSREVISLPMHWWITEEDVRTVVDTLKEV